MLDEVRQIGSTDRAWDLYGCSREALGSLTQEGMDADVQEAGFTIVGSIFKRFEGGGAGVSYLCAFEYFCLIEESHVKVKWKIFGGVAIHTAPENTCVELTIHTCDVAGLSSSGPSPKQKSIALLELWKKKLQPTHVSAFPLRRRGDKGASFTQKSLEVGTAAE